MGCRHPQCSSTAAPAQDLCFKQGFISRLQSLYRGNTSCLLSKHTLAGVWSSISHGCLIFLFGNDQNPQIEALTCYFHDFSELKVCSHPGSSYFSHPPHITASPAWLIHTPSSHFSKHQEKPHCSILYLSCISKAAIPCMCIQTAGFVAMYEHTHVLLSLDIERSRVPETGLCETYL